MGKNRTDKVPAKQVELNEHGFKKLTRITKDDLVDATTMLERGHSVSVIAKRLGLSDHQVRTIQDKRVDLKNRTDVIKDVLGDFWYVLADAALSKITDEKLEECSVAQLTTIAAIATDKARVLEGKPTEIVAAYESVIKKFILVNETVEGKLENKKNSGAIDVPFSVADRNGGFFSQDTIPDAQQYANQDNHNSSDGEGD